MTKPKTKVPPTVKIASKSAWAHANDRGPHVAVLPTGSAVKFELADLSMLLRAGRVPEHLRIVCQLAVAHADGIEGYFQDLVQTAIIRGGDAQATIAAAIAQGVELSHFLVSEMLVEPKVTPEEVAAGMFHELDVRMLLEFAERRRDTDAEGNKLGIMLLDPDQWARFRNGPDDAAGAANGGASGDAVSPALPDTDAGDV